MTVKMEMLKKNVVKMLKFTAQTSAIGGQHFICHSKSPSTKVQWNKTPQNGSSS